MAPRFLGGGGEMGALIRAHDCSQSPVGKPEQWPQAKPGMEILAKPFPVTTRGQRIRDLIEP